MDFVRKGSLLLLTIFISFNAGAVPITWILNDVAFDDGGNASGSFVYDADTDQYGPWDITTDPWGVTSTGVVDNSGLVYTPQSSTSFGGNLLLPSSKTVVFSNDVSIDDIGEPRFAGLALQFESNLTNAGGTVAIVPGASAENDITRSAQSRFVVGGSVLADGTLPLEIESIRINEPGSGRAVDSLPNLLDPSTRTATGFSLTVEDSIINIGLDLGVFGDFDILTKPIDYLGAERLVGELWEFGIEEIWNRGGAYAGASYNGVDYQIRFDVEFESIQFPTNQDPDFFIRGIDEVYVEGTSDPIWNALEWYSERGDGNNLIPLIAAHEFGHLIGLPDEYCPRNKNFFTNPFLCTNILQPPSNRQSNHLMVDLKPIVLDRHYDFLLDRINNQLDLGFVLGDLPPIGPSGFVVPDNYQIQDAHFANIPEPSALALLGLGIGGLGFKRRKS